MRLIIVSGRSGSGKSTALNVLEDSGFYCIDNLPAGLLPELAERALIHTELAQPLVAVSIDARNLPSADIAKAGETLRKFKDKVVIACCETGLSSGAAVRALQVQGFDKAVNLRGGLQAWRGDNLPLVKGDGRNDSKGKG